MPQDGKANSIARIERWRDIPGYEGCYRVSDHGRVLSLARRGADGRRLREKMLNPKFDGRYFQLCLSDREGNRKYIRLHLLVLLAFVGPRPEGCESRHLNDDQRDNRLSNLAYGTSKQNSEDQRRNKGFRKGLEHQNTVLTNQQIVEIRLLRRGEIGPWADKHGVSRGHVYNVRAGYRRKD